MCVLRVNFALSRLLGVGNNKLSWLTIHGCVGGV